MRTAAQLLDALRDAGATVEADGEQIRFSPGRLLTPELAAEITSQKATLLRILAAEAEYNHLHSEIQALARAAAANKMYGAVEAAGQQYCELADLVEGPYAAARRRLLDLLEPSPVLQPNKEPKPPRCQVCGCSVWWRRADGVQICGVCHPDPTGPDAMATGSVPNQDWRPKLRVLEEVA